MTIYELKELDKTIEICNFITKWFFNTRYVFESKNESFDELQAIIRVEPLLSPGYGKVSSIKFWVIKSEIIVEKSFDDFNSSIIQYFNFSDIYKSNKMKSHFVLGDLNLIECSKNEFDNNKGAFEFSILVYPEERHYIWCPELWMDWDGVDFSKDFTKNDGHDRDDYSHASGTSSFYELEDPKKGYILRGVGAVPRGTDREHGYY